MEVEVMRRVANICILTILIYIFLVWWLGKMQINKAGCTIKNGMERHYKKFDITQNIVLHAVLLV